MTSWKDKLALTAQRNRQEIIKAKLSRREMMRLGLLTSGGALIAKAGLSARAFAQQGPGGGINRNSLTVPGVDGQSPPVTPWKVPMPRLWVQQPIDYHNMEYGTKTASARRRSMARPGGSTTSTSRTTPTTTRSAPAARAASSRRSSTNWR